LRNTLWGENCAQRKAESGQYGFCLHLCFAFYVVTCCQKRTENKQEKTEDTEKNISDASAASCFCFLTSPSLLDRRCVLASSG
jgi:hypothetical protein